MVELTKPLALAGDVVCLGCETVSDRRKSDRVARQADISLNCVHQQNSPLSYHVCVCVCVCVVVDDRVQQVCKAVIIYIQHALTIPCHEYTQCTYTVSPQAHCFTVGLVWPRSQALLRSSCGLSPWSTCVLASAVLSCEQTCRYNYVCEFF